MKRKNNLIRCYYSSGTTGFNAYSFSDLSTRFLKRIPSLSDSNFPCIFSLKKNILQKNLRNRIVAHIFATDWLRK